MCLPNLYAFVFVRPYDCHGQFPSSYHSRSHRDGWVIARIDARDVNAHRYITTFTRREFA